MSSKQKTSLGARFLLSFIGLALAIAGGVFTWLLWVSYQRANVTRAWNETACLIQRSTVDEERDSLNEPVKYRPHIVYTYLVGDTSYKSEQIRKIPEVLMFKEKDQAEDLIKKYPLSQGSKCFVDPADPNSSVLIHETRAGLYSIWFPLLFVVGGLGMVINIWWPEPEDVEEETSAPEAAATAITGEGAPKAES